MANSAIASVRGYDELYPHHLNIVSEARLYARPLLSAGITKG